MQPTAQAVGKEGKSSQAPEGRKKTTYTPNPTCRFGYDYDMCGDVIDGSEFAANAKKRHSAIAMTLSIPNIFRVVLNMILFQKRNKLFLERMLLVMLVLFGDVFDCCCGIGFTHAEHAAPGLPRKIGKMFFAHPS